VAAKRRRLLAVTGLAAALLALVFVWGIFRITDRRGLDLVAAWAAASGPRVSFTIDPNSLERGPYLDAVYVGNVADPALEELSGLAGSLRRDDLLWAVNDGGSEARLFAFSVDGHRLGSARIQGASIEDSEDLAAFELDGLPYLLIADVGDNFSWRKSVTLHVVEEPRLDDEGLAEDAELPIVWTTRFRYEDGPRDCEAVAVDAARGQVLLLSKREVPAALYRLPLSSPDAAPPTGELPVARRLTELTNIPQPTAIDLEEDRERGHYRSYPTSMDIAPDGSAAVVLTLKRAYRFARRPGESWADAFTREPQTIPIPPVYQLEALTFARHGRSLFISPEKRPAPIFRLDLPPADSPSRGPG
jgi:hypothetical protein